MGRRSRPARIIGGVARAMQVAAVGTWYLVPTLPRRNPVKVARAASRACHSLGSTYLKFGQLVASSPGLVGDDVALEFRSCLDTGPPIKERALRASLAHAAGRTVEETYRSVDLVPLGTASIAVVHAAETVAGRQVALKVQRPGVADRVATDISILRGLALTAMRVSKSSDAAEAVDLIDDLDRNLQEELDFTMERESMRRIGARIAAHGFERVTVPAVHAELSDRHVLAMDLLDGVAIDDMEALAGRPLAGELVDEAIRVWLTTSLVDGEFHGDCHAGNVLVLHDDRLGLIDWGIVGRLDDAARLFFIRLLEGALGDDVAWGDVASHFVRLYGEDTYAQLHTTEAALPGVLRDLLGPMLTAPFGESALGDFLARIRERSAQAAQSGRGPISEEVRERTRDAESELGSFDHGLFLWLKQLVFFERYARLHGRSRSIASHAADILPNVPRPTPAT
jgi:predicted unusual protein kinase regulating ubiquinone biosynthesis (AarF/ABC1/UbiB family)